MNPDMNNPEFPKTSKRVQEMKHNPKEASRMCKLVEDYAKELVIQEAVELAIEYDRSKEETIARLERKFELSEKEALEYYEMFAPQPV